MTWRILTDQAWFDLERLQDSERSSVVDDLMAWIEHGPPRQARRQLGGAELFEHRLPSGFDVVYLVDERVPYVAVLRVRKARRPGPGNSRPT